MKIVKSRYCNLVVVFFFFTQCNDHSPTTGKQTALPNKISFQVNNPYSGVDKSPMDMSYYPPNFPTEKMNGKDSLGSLVARVIYSRPQKNGREIFADSSVKTNYIQQYGKEWRLGANEATEIEFFKPVMIQRKPVAAGRYIIYCIPYPDKWIIKLNNNLFSWGLHMNTQKDIMEASLPVYKTNDSVEYFTMVFQKTETGANLLMAWGNIKVLLPLVFN